MSSTRYAVDIIREAQPRHLVELGSGACRRIRLLLDAWCGPGTCTLLDINALFLERSVSALRAAYRRVDFRTVVGDFTTDLGRLGQGGERLTMLFAGTIGNLHHCERRAFFAELGRRMERSDTVLLGVDLVKDPARLVAAYNDPEGVTAAFNRNALRVVGRRFGAEVNPLEFAHRAFYDPPRARIEMRLVAERPVHLTFSQAGVCLDLRAGAELRTEVSHKFTRGSLDAAVVGSGLRVTRWYTDPEELFALALLRRMPS